MTIGAKDLIQRVVLTGYMGAGKSVVGQALATNLGWDFMDTDALIAGMAGRSIPDLFAEGEDVFRAWERQAIATLVHRNRLVVATGGGAVTDAESRGLLAAMGPVVCLCADPEVLWDRAGGDSDRPLSVEKWAFLARLEDRQALYAEFPLQYDTTSGLPAAIAAQIHGDLFGANAQVAVGLGERGYAIHVAVGGLAALPDLLGGPAGGGVAPGDRGTCLVVTDDGVPHWYGEVVERSLTYAGWAVHRLVIPAGEQSKSLAMAERLYDACVQAGLRRHHPVIALGGGVVGDLAGFVAATYQRGVPFIQVPTTLLAQIDSSVGGKVAVNHAQGKNMIGAFYQPRVVLADVSTLLTLSEREYRAGLGEMVKYGVIMDPALFALMEREVAALAARRLPLLAQLVARCCELKALVVAEDEREAPGGRRTTLNFGHTVGHAIESVAGYGQVLHGEAVAIGMVAAARLATGRGLFSLSALGRLERLLGALGLETRLPELDPEALCQAMGRDKKNRDAGVTFVLPTAIGEVVLAAIPLDAVRALLAELASNTDPRV